MAITPWDLLLFLVNMDAVARIMAMSCEKRPDDSPLAVYCSPLRCLGMQWRSGLYIFALLLLPMVGGVLDGTSEKLVTESLFAALPVGLLLLLAMPAGLTWATFRRPVGGFGGRLVMFLCR